MTAITISIPNHEVGFFKQMISKMGWTYSEADVVRTAPAANLVPAVGVKKARRKRLNASDYAGIWDDEHYMAAEDINKAIREARHVRSSRDELLSCP